MKKLLCIVFVLLLLFPSVVMAEQEQPETSIRPVSDRNLEKEKEYDIGVLSQGSREGRNAAEATVAILNEVEFVENEGEPKVSIWTPKDYDPEKKYAIFVFLQGSGENLNVAEVTATEHYGVLISDIYETIDADFIVVGIQDGSNFDIISNRVLYALSYAADHYSTYAASGSSQDLKNAREHIIIGGISNGGKMATYFAIHYNDYVANAIIMSPTTALNPGEGFNLKHLFVCIGTNDNVPCRPAARSSYAKLSPYAEKPYFSLYEGRHQWKFWNGQIVIALNWVFETGEFKVPDDIKQEFRKAPTLITPLFPCKLEKPLAVPQ